MQYCYRRKLFIPLFHYSVIPYSAFYKFPAFRDILDLYPCFSLWSTHATWYIQQYPLFKWTNLSLFTDENYPKMACNATLKFQNFQFSWAPEHLRSMSCPFFFDTHSFLDNGSRKNNQLFNAFDMTSCGTKSLHFLLFLKTKWHLLIYFQMFSLVDKTNLKHV